MSRIVFRLLLIPVFAAAMLLGFSGAASAHDQLISTTPTANSTANAPQAVSLKFSANVLKVGTEVEVTGPQGPVAAGGVTITGPVVSQRLKSNLVNGAYTVLWRVTSQDGHPVSGKFAFTVTGATTTSSAGSSSTASSSTTSSSATSSSPSVPPQQVPTNKTNNEPWVIVGLVALAAAVIGGGVLISRRRLKDDD